MAHRTREFSRHDPDSRASTDESAPPPVPMAPMNKPMFSNDSGGSLGGSTGTTLWRYKGVRYRANKWVSEIRYLHQKIWLGSYPTLVEAAFAHDVAVTCLDGHESRLNFHHPIYRNVPRIPPTLSPQEAVAEVRRVVMWARETGNSDPMTLAGKPKYNTDSGGSPGGLPGTALECPDLCPECGETFLASKYMLLHLNDHWRDQKFSPPAQTSRDSGGDSRSPGMNSRWWLMYKGVRYCLVHDEWAAWTRLPHGNEISLGLYSTTLEAAYAYDVAVTCLGGESMLNFCRHPIYKQIPRISSDLPAVVVELERAVKEFGKLAMEAGFSGMPGQETTWMDFSDMSRARKSARDKNTLLISGTQQAGDLDTFQKNTSRCFRDISGSDGDYPEDYSASIQWADDIMKEIPEVADIVEMLAMSPPYSSISAPDISDSWPTIEPTNTRNKQPYQPVSPGLDMLTGHPDGALKFTMADLNIITENFSESLTVGQGGSGSVYRGQLKDGTTVAVKRIKKKDKNVLEIEDAKDFQTEADTLSKDKHVNLVRLLGYLEDENEHILVTEYVTNGNLRQHLDGVPYGVILDMSKRCWISLDVVAVVKHLHNQTKDDLNIIRRDIKSSDILITDDFRAKVAGFGLSRRSPFGDVGASSSSTQVKRTVGYMAHEHLTTHHLKEQNDVYSIGELLVEIFTGKRLVESSLHSDECFTPRWVLKQCAEGRLLDIIDPEIPPTLFNLKILEQIFKLAASCLVLEESSRPTAGDVFGGLSFIVDHYFGDLKDESNSKGDKSTAQKVQKWDLEAYVEPILQTPRLKELEALERRVPTKHLDNIDSSDPSFLPTKPHGSLFVEGSKSNKVQTSIQLGTQLEVDSKQATRRALELLVAKQDQTSPMFIDIIPDVFQLKPDETYFEMLQEEIARLGYISRLLSEDDGFEQNLTNTSKTSFFLYFNERDDVFEFYFKNYQGMASIIGVGLECAKVVLEDGWRVTVQEISKPNWDDAWKNFESSSSSMKVTLSEPLDEGMDNMEDSQIPVASIPRGQCLLLDLAQYFILKMAIASFLSRALVTNANSDSGTSSSPSSQDIASSSSSSDQKFSRLVQALGNMFSLRGGSNQQKTENGDGTPIDPPEDDDVRIDTIVHLKLLPGGCLNRLDVAISDDEELKTLTSQLDDTICFEMMMFKFLNEGDRKEIQVTVGPISFQFPKGNEDNYKTTGRFGWYHTLLEVSFGPVNARLYSEIGLNHSALDIVKVKKIKTIGSSDATSRGTSNSMNGGVKGKIPHIFTLSGGGISEWSNSSCVTENAGYAIEKEFEETRGGFAICPKRNYLSSTLDYTYLAPDHNFEIDLQELHREGYRKRDLNTLPMCRPQEVKFEGTWHPKKSNPQVLVEYSLMTSRVVHMTSKEISEKDVKKSRNKRWRQPKIQKKSNEALEYTQKYARRFFLNHAMTHLNGEKFEVEEILSQRTLNERGPETHLEDLSRYASQWRANPFVLLNSELDYQP